jgi:uncharacterized ubiquitin-like protein YukD
MFYNKEKKLIYIIPKGQTIESINIKEKLIKVEEKRKLFKPIIIKN